MMKMMTVQPKLKLGYVLEVEVDVVVQVVVGVVLVIVFDIFVVEATVVVAVDTNYLALDNLNVVYLSSLVIVMHLKMYLLNSCVELPLMVLLVAFVDVVVGAAGVFVLDDEIVDVNFVVAGVVDVVDVAGVVDVVVVAVVHAVVVTVVFLLMDMVLAVHVLYFVRDHLDDVFVINYKNLLYKAVLYLFFLNLMFVHPLPKPLQ